MNENLVGYLLGALDAEEQRAVEKYLETEPGARQNLETLRRALAPLEADKDTIDPPPGLRMRAIARVAEYRCRPLPAAPPSPARFVAGGRPWWMRLDLVAAAALLLVAVGLGTIWVANHRAEAGRVACQGNLNHFRQALYAYADNHDGELPHIKKDAPRHVAATFLPMLREAAVLPENLSSRCPANGEPVLDAPSFADLDALSDEEFLQRVRQRPGCYAYSLGHLQNGEHRPPRLIPARLNNGILPVMADHPAVKEDDPSYRGNSPNHNGQNVLFLDGSVRFLREPFADMEKQDHIFLNRDGKVAAGVDQWDSVLGWRDDRP